MNKAVGGGGGTVTGREIEGGGRRWQWVRHGCGAVFAPLFDMVGLILAHPGRCGRGPNMSAGGQSLRASRCPWFIFSSSAGGCCGVWLCLFGLLDRAFVDTGFRTEERCCFASAGALCWLDYKQRNDSYFLLPGVRLCARSGSVPPQFWRFWVWCWLVRLDVRSACHE